MTRLDGRHEDALRPIRITTDFIEFAEGSCLIECGNTKVLCCASVEERVPPHVAEGCGWRNILRFVHVTRGTERYAE